MALLVTGGAGYIGSQMVHELVDAGERVVVLDDLSTGFRWAVPEGVPLVIGETGDQALVARLIRDHEVDRSSISPLRSSCRIQCVTRWAIIAITPSIRVL